MSLTIEKKIAQRRTKDRSCGSEGKSPTADLARNPTENLNNKTPPGGVVALGGVFLCLSWSASGFPLCGSVRLSAGRSCRGWYVDTSEQIKTPCGAFFGLLRGEGKRKAPEGLRLVRGFGLTATNGGGASDLPTIEHGRQARRGLCTVCGLVAGSLSPGLGNSRSRTGAGSPLLWC